MEVTRINIADRTVPHWTPAEKVGWPCRSTMDHHKKWCNVAIVIFHNLVIPKWPYSFQLFMGSDADRMDLFLLYLMQVHFLKAKHLFLPFPLV